ncbi:hypothetical protein L1887_05035 [Cichorium endivia]|nr:hypothetical protein L1887_05035 [Cichorium endivia]
MQNLLICQICRLAGGQKLRKPNSINVDGAMVDTWWGILEANTPKHCKWKVYQKLCQIAHASDLRLQ